MTEISLPIHEMYLFDLLESSLQSKPLKKRKEKKDIVWRRGHLQITDGGDGDKIERKKILNNGM